MTENARPDDLFPRPIETGNEDNGAPLTLGSAPGKGADTVGKEF